VAIPVVVAVPTGLIASALTEVRREEKERRQEAARAAQFDNRKGPIKGGCLSKDAAKVLTEDEASRIASNSLKPKVKEAMLKEVGERKR
jgi:uncharacterized membrane protein YkoI